MRLGQQIFVCVVLVVVTVVVVQFFLILALTLALVCVVYRRCGLVESPPTFTAARVSRR